MKDLSGVINISVNRIHDAIHNADLSKEEIREMIEVLETMLGRKLSDEFMGRV